MFNVRSAVLLNEDYRRRRKYAAEQQLTKDDALRTGMEDKAGEFAEAGAEIYSKA